MLMRKTKRMIGLGAMALCLSVLSASAQDMTTFRGPARDGQYAETGLLKQWPADGPEMLWETNDVGKGYSTPVIVGDRLYVTGMNENENQETFNAYTLDGKKVYTIAYGKPWRENYPETRTTPTIVDGKAYMVSGSGEVVCINIADGKIVWRIDGLSTYGGRTGHWGTAECPLVYDNKVIYTPGGSQTSMVALDKETGKEIWKTKSLRANSAYISPILVTWKGKRQIIGGIEQVMFGVNPDNGDIEWTFTDWPSPNTYENIAPNSPLFKDGSFFFSEGYDTGGFMIKLNDTMTAATKVWKTDDLDTHHGGYVLIDGVIYGSNWVNNNAGNWVAIDWNTGKTLYNTGWSGGKGKGSTVAADGMLYTHDERRGFVGLVRPSKDKYDVVSEFRVSKGSGPSWAHLVINRGVLYVRHGEYMAAYKVK